MHNIPHTQEAKEKIRKTKLNKPYKWGNLPEEDITFRLLNTNATIVSIADEYGCSPSTIKLIYRKHSKKEERENARRRKQANKLRGRKNPQLSELLKNNNFWIGRKHKEKSKIKMSLSHKGKKVSLMTRIKNSALSQKIKLNNWNGFVTSKNERERRSNKFKEWRLCVFERDNYTCQLCKKRGGKLHPHHIKTFAKNVNLRYNVNNGITLCAEPCHKKTIRHEKEYEILFMNIILNKLVGLGN